MLFRGDHTLDWPFNSFISLKRRNIMIMISWIKTLKKSTPFIFPRTTLLYILQYYSSHPSAILITRTWPAIVTGCNCDVTTIRLAAPCINNAHESTVTEHDCLQTCRPEDLISQHVRTQWTTIPISHTVVSQRANLCYPPRDTLCLQEISTASGDERGMIAPIALCTS